VLFSYIVEIKSMIYNFIYDKMLKKVNIMKGGRKWKKIEKEP
jgi:hypothetical protein